MVRLRKVLLSHGLEDRVASNVYPGKIMSGVPATVEPQCVDCGIENRAMICPPCAERLAEDVIHARLDEEDNKPTLKLFEVAIDPIQNPRHGGSSGHGDWRFVMVLSTDEESAVDSAFDVLVLPYGRDDLTWNVHECKGPFVKGSILSVKTIPAK